MMLVAKRGTAGTSPAAPSRPNMAKLGSAGLEVNTVAEVARGEKQDRDTPMPRRITPPSAIYGFALVFYFRKRLAH